MTDSSFWVFVAFVLIIAGLYRPGKAAIFEYLDTNIENYALTIKHAQTLRNENVDLLALAQTKKNNATEETRKIISHAKNEAKRIEKMLHDQRGNLMIHAQNLTQKRYELGLAEIESQLYKNISIQAFENVKK
jgi:F0F1-type ATP synthase membrane subunit b/b'